MSDFINTVDVLGDTAVLDSILDRSIVELRDNRIKTIGTYAFSECDKLTLVDAPNVTRICSGAFEDVSSGTLTLNLPSLTTIDANGCAYAGNLKVINAPNLTSIGGNGFRQSGIQNIDFPLLVNGAGSGFIYCASLTDVKLPNLTTIADSMFYGCIALKKLDFPSVTSIVNYGVGNCSSLTALILRRNSVATLANASNILSGTPIASGTGYIYVPSALVDSYKAATNWSTYANQIRAIEDWSVDGTVTGEIVLPVVMYSLVGVISSNTETSIKYGAPYLTTLTLKENYIEPVVTITMGGVDITEDVYDSETGEVNIPIVTGDIIIDVSATSSLPSNRFTILGKNSSASWFHFTILCAPPANAGAVVVTLIGSDAINIGTSGNVGSGAGLYFGDNSGDVSNSSYSGAGPGVTTIFTNDAGNIVARVSGTLSMLSTQYIKYILCIPVSTLPASFTIDDISVTIDGVKQNILKYGGFFTTETWELSQ